MLTPGTVSGLFSATIASFNFISGTSLDQLFNAYCLTPII